MMGMRWKRLVAATMTGLMTITSLPVTGFAAEEDFALQELIAETESDGTLVETLNGTSSGLETPETSAEKDAEIYDVVIDGAESDAADLFETTELTNEQDENGFTENAEAADDDHFDGLAEGIDLEAEELPDGLDLEELSLSENPAGETAETTGTIEAAGTIETIEPAGIVETDDEISDDPDVLTVGEPLGDSVEDAFDSVLVDTTEEVEEAAVLSAEDDDTAVYHITVYATGALNEIYDPDSSNYNFKVYTDQVYSEFDVAEGDFFSLTTYGYLKNADPHYIHDGWRMYPDGDTQIDHEHYFPTSDMAVCPYWSEAYALTVDANGGELVGYGTDRTVVAVAKDSYYMSDIRAVRDGFAFGGWSVEDGSGNLYEVDHLYDIWPSSDCTARAIWKTGVRLTLDYNGGRNPYADETETSSVVLVPEGEPIGSSISLYLRNEATNEDSPNYELDGWSLTPDGDPIDLYTYVPDGDMKLYAHWRAYSDVYTNPVEGYFPGWSVGYDMHMQVDYGSLLYESIAWDEPTIDDPDLAFDCWYLDVDRTMPVTEDYRIRTSCQFVYAGYRECWHVTFDANGGSFYNLGDADDIYTRKIAKGRSVNCQYDSMRNGVYITGWALDPEGENKIELTDGWMLTPTSDMTLYAVYEEEQPYEPDDPDDLHNYEWVVTVEPTCTESGTRVQICQDEGCGATGQTETIRALGHDNYVSSSAVAATCVTAGMTAELTCSRCGLVTAPKTVKALGHDFKTTKTAVAATCTAGGKTSEIKCGRCGFVKQKQTATNPLGHVYRTTKAAVAATCTKEGKTEEISCTRCKHVKQPQKATNPLGHKTYVSKKAVAATCTETGKTAEYKCSRCGTVTQKQTKTAALGHHFVATATVAATCKAAGHKGGTHCSRCQLVKTAPTKIPKTDDHSFGSWKTTKAATVFKKGEKTRSCKVCGKKETKTIAKAKAVLSLNKSSVTLLIGKYANGSVKITASKIGNGDSITSWKSSNTSVATVSGGTIHAKKKGSAVITAKTKGGASDTVKVTVKNSDQKTSGISVTVAGTTINGKKGSRKTGSATDGTITLKMGKTAAIKVSLTPATTSQKVSYSVEGLNGYISVNSSGVITAKKTTLFGSM